MVTILPFKGVYFNTQNLPLSDVISPPYDVLSPQQQEALYTQHPNNVVRIILNKETPEDTPFDNRYTRSADTLRQWLQEGILTQDSEPAYYEYIQRFRHPNPPHNLLERTTLLVALKLDPYQNGNVLPHEETHPKAKTDRLNLMRTTNANPEPIYGLYEDPTETVYQSLKQMRSEAKLLLEAKVLGASGEEEHQVYRHTNDCLISDIQDFFYHRRVWIADGHHRYETGLNFQKERREAGGEAIDSAPYDYLLIGLSAFEDRGLVVLPTHRLVKGVEKGIMESLALRLGQYFDVKAMPHNEARNWIKEEVQGQKRFALILKAMAFGLTLKSDVTLSGEEVDHHCDAWKALDVALLQTLVLDKTLGIGWEELAHTQNVAYTRDLEEAIAKVEDDTFQMAFLLQNPTVTEVRDVASAGDKMPQKSTFFFPKLWSGLILRLLEG